MKKSYLGAFLSSKIFYLGLAGVISFFVVSTPVLAASFTTAAAVDVPASPAVEDSSSAVVGSSVLVTSEVTPATTVSPETIPGSSIPDDPADSGASGSGATISGSASVGSGGSSGVSSFSDAVFQSQVLPILRELTTVLLQLQEVLSDEAVFATLAPAGGTTLSGEITTTLLPPATVETVSGELSFTTNDDNGGNGGDEGGTSLSDEIFIKTEGGITGLETVSEEIAASTTLTGGVTVSGETSATTDAADGDDDGGDNGGGGGGGGGDSVGGPGGRRFIFPPAPPVAPAGCPIYLRAFIKFGADNNDPIEVAKLQAFLRTFEGQEQILITGVYDSVTERAVRAFQQKYSRDVLGPWGIEEPTGYVFITTRYAVNAIYCARTTANTFDLRNFYPQVLAAEVTDISELPPWWPAPLSGSEAEAAAGGNRFQLAAVAVLDFLSAFGYLFSLVLLLIATLVILYLLIERRRMLADAPTSGPQFTELLIDEEEAGSPPKDSPGLS